MIKNLFIMGAGASKPYGFPIGFDLRQWLIKNIVKVFGSNAYLKNMDLHPNSLENFSIAFDRSKTNSVDLFLSRNRQYAPIGKAGIAHMIIECEKRGFGYVADPEDDWYFYLFNRLTAGITDHRELANVFNDYSFVTFNYDRSFEAFLSESMFFSFFSQHPSFEEVDFTKIPAVDVLHMYGSIGKYPDRPYSAHPRYTYEVTEAAIKSLNTIYEERTTDATVKERISLAKRIFFLGFAYLPENMERLGISDSLMAGKEVYGTAFGNQDAEIRRIERYFHGSKVCNIENTKSINLLKSYL